MRPAKRQIAQLGATIALTAFATVASGATALGAERTERVSVSSSGAEAINCPPTSERRDFCQATAPAISADGRYVAFASGAFNLVADDSNGKRDIFVHDFLRAETTRVSVSSSGAQAKSSSDVPDLSADGRYVAFSSAAENLVEDQPACVAAGCVVARDQIYVRDRDSGTTERVSVSSGGVPALLADPILSSQIQTTSPAISADGRYVAFGSLANNLVAGDTNRRWDVFVHDRRLHTTTRVSVSSAGLQGDSDSYEPSISADGRFVTFGSQARNFADGRGDVGQVYVHDRDADADGIFDAGAIKTTRVSVPSDVIEGNSFNEGTSLSLPGDISADGRYVLFESFADNLVAGDTNSRWDVFVHDRDADENGAFDEPGKVSTRRVSVSSDGTQAQGSSSLRRGGVRYQLGDIFTYQGQDRSPKGSISADGRYVAFGSTANLAPGDSDEACSYELLLDSCPGWDIFVRDRQSGSTRLVSLSSTGADGNTGSGHAVISASGCYWCPPGEHAVAFGSLAPNLVARDTNLMEDVFLRAPTVAPVARDDTTATDAGIPTTIDALKNDSDRNADPLTVTNLTQPAHGSARVNADKTVTYTPADGYSGADSFTYTASDGDATSNIARVSITVRPVTITLSATTGARSGKYTTINLRWSGAPGEQVDLYRNGVLQVRTANDGAYDDAVSGKGTWTYKICVAGSKLTCSNQASVKT